MIEGKFIEYVLINYGVFGVAIVGVLYAVLKLPNPINSIKTFIGWFKSTRIQHHTPRDVLMSKLDYWVNFKINNLRMNDPGRQLIFRDMLLLKFTQFRNFVDETHSQVDESITGSELFHMTSDIFDATIKRYEAEARDRGIPEVVIIKYREWQRFTYDFSIRAIESICMTNSFGTNESRIQSIYNIIITMMELTIAEAEKSLTELNGELTGIEYKGVTCG